MARPSLLAAASAGDLPLVQRLLAGGGASIAEQDNAGLSALLLAALYGHLPVVQWLLAEGGASIAERNNNGYSALLCAALNGQLPVVQWLLAEGGANIKERSNDGDSALLNAAKEGRLPVMLWLLAAGGADISDVNEAGDSAWSLLADSFRRGDILDSDPELVPLLRVMFARGAPPPGFADVLHTPDTLAVVRQGELLRARLPAYLSRLALLRAHAALPPPGLVEIVAGYAEPCPEELWDSELVRVGAGTKRKRDDEGADD